VRKFILIPSASDELIMPLDIGVPTLLTPWIDFPRYMRENILHRIDVHKKWNGCWMYRKGLGRSKEGEPHITYLDLAREGGRQYQQRHTKAKDEIAKAFFDTSRVPSRKNGNPAWTVVHLCGNIDCLNPSHLGASLRHWRQIDVEEERKNYLNSLGPFYVGAK
jgi:hypothetical protein